MHFENREHWLLPDKENATHCSRDRPSFHTPRDYHGHPRALPRRILIGYLSGCIQNLDPTSLGMIGMSEQSPPQRVSFRENSSQQTIQKTVFTQDFS
jgi:hypothetical protein